jgi:pilus assembly protein CpaC
MGRATPIRPAAFAALVSCFAAGIVSWVPAPGAAGAAEHSVEAQTNAIVVAASDYVSRSVLLNVGKTMVIDFPRDIKDVLVGNPKIANAVVRSSRRAYIISIANGGTNIFFFDAEGKEMASLSITVGLDVSPIRLAIRRIIPSGNVEVQNIGDGIILTGTVATPADAQQAYDIASRFVATGESFVGGGPSGGGGDVGGSSSSVSVAGTGSGLGTVVGLGSSSKSGGAGSQKVVNAIVVREREQVMLKVTVAEVERDLIKQLGINLSGTANVGSAVINFNNSNPFTAFGQSLSGSSIAATSKSLTGTLQAMEQAGVIHTLAEPNLTAISGETATFLAGGEFPILNGYSCSATSTTPGAPTTCQPSIQFKNFGVSLHFTPIVLSEGRISLKVLTEVSDISAANSLTIPIPGTTGPGSSVTIPSIRTRRADTTVEIPSGGALALAGMIQNETRHNANGLPGLMELPILGPLFKSNDYINQQTELMVLVTPFIVHAVAQKDLSRPDDGFADPSDPAQVLLGRFNRIYGVGGIPDPPDNYRGKYGFILD